METFPSLLQEGLTDDWQPDMTWWGFFFPPPSWNCNLKSGRCAALRCQASKSWNIKCQDVFPLKYLTASRTTGSCWYKQNNRCCSINRSMKGGKNNSVHTVTNTWFYLLSHSTGVTQLINNTHTNLLIFCLYRHHQADCEPWLSLRYKSPESRSQILCDQMTPVEEFHLLWWWFCCSSRTSSQLHLFPGTVWSKQSWIEVVTSAEEVRFSTVSVCWLVCQQRYTKTTEQNGPH